MPRLATCLPTCRRCRASANPIRRPLRFSSWRLHRKSIPPSDMYDAADTVIAQRISQVDGVAEVQVAGAEQPAIRMRVDPGRLAAMGLSIEDVRTAITNANAMAPLGIIDGDQRAVALETNAQLRKRRGLQGHHHQGGERHRGDGSPPWRASSRARATRVPPRGSITNPRYLLTIVKSADANVIDTVDRIQEMLPRSSAGSRPASTFPSCPIAPRRCAPACTTCSSRWVCRSCWSCWWSTFSCAGRRPPSPPASPCRCRWRAPAPPCGAPASRSTT